MPVYNKSGKYWVKLYSNGREVKVQIDDRLPFGNDKLLFPSVQKGNELWPSILTKAVIKLLLSNHQPAQIYGNPLVFYYLTGMICKQMPI